MIASFSYPFWSLFALTYLMYVNISKKGRGATQRWPVIVPLEDTWLVSLVSPVCGMSGTRLHSPVKVQEWTFSETEL